MAANLQHLEHQNLLAGPDVKVTASSAASEASSAARVRDGLQAHGWRCAPDDDAPRLQVELPRPTRCEGLLITPFDACLRDRGRHDTARALELWINGDLDRRLESTSPLDPIDVRFERTRRIKTLELRVVERSAGEVAGSVGFAELVLYRKRR